MSEDIWVMEEECCSTCGALLHPQEDVLCTDCLHDAWYAEDQERETAWFNEDDDMKEEQEQEQERENPTLRSDSEATKKSSREILAKKMRDWYWWFWVRLPRR